MENPDASGLTNTGFTVSEITGGQKTVEYEWGGSPTGWTMVRDGVEIRTYSSWNADQTEESITRVVKNDQGGLLKKEVSVYKDLALGRTLIRHVLDPDGENEITNLGYYGPGDGDTIDGRLKSVEYPDGRWVRYRYDAQGRKTHIVRPYLNTPMNSQDSQCRVTEVSYFYDQTPIKEVSSEYVAGVLIGKTEVEKTRTASNHVTTTTRFATPTSGAHDPDNTTEITYLYGIGQNTGRLWKAKRGDGTVELYVYQESLAGDTETVTHYSGYSAESVSDDNFSGADFLEGTRSVTVRTINGVLFSRRVYDIATGLQLEEKAATQLDDFGRVKEYAYLDGTTENMTYACCGLESVTSREGIVVDYTYTSSGQVKTETRGDVKTVYHYDGLGRIKMKWLSASEEMDTANMILQSEVEYDLLGRIEHRKISFQDGLITLNGEQEDTEALNNTTFIRKTTINPDGGTTVRLYYLDGTLYQVTGTAVNNERYFTSYDSLGRTLKTTVPFAAGENPDVSDPRGFIRVTDMLGRLVEVGRPAPNNGPGKVPTQYAYDVNGRLDTTVDPSNVVTKHWYDHLGNRWKTRVGNPPNIVVSTTASGYEMNADGEVARFTVSRSGYDDADRQTVLAANLSDPDTTIQYYNLEDGESTFYANGSGRSTSVVYGDPLEPLYSKIVTSTDENGGVIVRKYGKENGYLLEESFRKRLSGDTLTRTTYSNHNLHGSPETVTDLNNRSTMFTFYNDGQLKATTDPLNRTTEYFSTNNPVDGRTSTTTFPDDREVVQEMDTRGNVVKTYGGDQYPVEYQFDYRGNMTLLTTWKDYTGQTGAVHTSWHYYNNDGALKQKRFDANADGTGGSDGPTYVYDGSGRLFTRAWARIGGNNFSPVSTRYDYRPGTGQLEHVVYLNESQGVDTPDVSYVYDNSGRPTSITDGSGTRQLVYDKGFSTETFGGSLDGIVLSRTPDAFGRLETLTLTNDMGHVSTTTYAYDPETGRLGSIASSDGSFEMLYEDGTSRHAGTRLQRAGKVLNRRIVFDDGGRVGQALSEVDAVPAVHVEYAYDDSGRRSRQSRLTQGRYWEYGYDELGQVESATAHVQAGLQPDPLTDPKIPGHEFMYQFDGIGNRTEAGRDGDPQQKKEYFSGANLTGTVGANDLNQIGSVRVPRLARVLGEAVPNATIGVPGANVDRLGKYFQAFKDYSGQSDPDAPKIETWSITAELAGGGADGGVARSEKDKKVELTGTSRNFVYDPDGNLTSDGRRLYTWNAENRLVTITTDPAMVAAGAENFRLELAYDSQGRRWKKEVFVNDVLKETHIFIYDGWNLIAEREMNQTTWTTHTWGPDLSGSPQGAGGVGGLLASRRWDSGEAAWEHAYPLYDGNGNVLSMLDGDFTEIASYDYGPFGEPLRASGKRADQNPFRFSTKYQDAETGWYYYGFRYYDPETGRWPNRDPIEEQGGYNLYGFVGNNSVNHHDYLGNEISLTATWNSKDLIDILNIRIADSIPTLSKAKFTPPLSMPGGGSIRVRLWGNIPFRGSFNDSINCCLKADAYGYSAGFSWTVKPSTDFEINVPFRADIYPAMYAIPFLKITKAVKYGVGGLKGAAAVRNFIRGNSAVSDAVNNAAKGFCISELLGISASTLKVTLPEKRYDDIINLIDW